MSRRGLADDVRSVHRFFLKRSDAKHDGVLGRRDVKPDDIPDFGNEVGIARQFECLDPVRLEAESTPDPLRGGDRDPGCLGHPARTFQGLHNDRLNTDILDRTWNTRARLIMQPVQPVRDKAAEPFAYRSLGNDDFELQISWDTRRIGSMGRTGIESKYLGQGSENHTTPRTSLPLSVESIEQLWTPNLLIPVS